MLTAAQLRSSNARQEKPLNASGFPLGRWYGGGLLDDFNDAARTRIDQNRSIVDDRIAIIASTVFRRNVVIGDACFRKYCAYCYVAFVAV